MNSAFFRFLLRRHALSCGLCMLPPIAIGLILGLFYPTFQDSQPMLSGFMPVVQRLFGGGVLDMMSPLGFLIISFGHPLTHASLAVVACVPAMSTPAGARGDGTLELLMATRLERRQLVATVYVTTLTAGAFVAMAPLLGSSLGSLLIKDLANVELLRLVPITANAFGLMALLGSVALLLSVGAPERAVALRRYAIFTFGVWIIDVFAQLYEWTWLSRCTPFGWYRPPQVAMGESVVPRTAVLLSAAAVLFTVAMIQAHRSRRA